MLLKSDAPTLYYPGMIVGQDISAVDASDSLGMLICKTYRRSGIFRMGFMQGLTR